MPRKIITAILLGGLSLGLFIHYQVRAPRRNFSDYRVYYKAGRDVLEGKNIYVRETEEITPYKYSPVFALFMSGLSTGSRRVSASIFFILNLIFVFFIFELTRRMIFFRKITPNKEFLLLALVLIINSRFILHCLDSGQVGILISFLLVLGLFLLSLGKDWKAAFLIGFSVMIKYMPFLFVIYFILKRKFKVGGLILLSMVFYCLIPAIFTGFRSNLLYLKEWIPYITSTSLDQGSMITSKNHSLWTLPLRLFPNISSFNAKLVTMALFIILMSFIVSRKRNISKSGGKICLFYNCLDYAMIFILIPLFNPNAWLHNFVILVFPYMAVVYYLFVNGFKDKIVLFLVFFSFILSSVGSRSLAGDNLQTILDCLFLVPAGALLLFAALAKIKFANDIYKPGELN